METTDRMLPKLNLIALTTAMLIWVHAAASNPSLLGATEIVPLAVADLTGMPVTALTSGGPDDTHLKIVEGEGRGFVSKVRYSSLDQRLKVNVKRFEPTTLELVDWPIDEFMVLVSGRVEITGPTHAAHIYNAGDAFVIPKGFSGRWRQLSTIEMYTVEFGVAK